MSSKRRKGSSRRSRSGSKSALQSAGSSITQSDKKQQKGFAKLKGNLKEAVTGDDLEHFRRMSVSVHFEGKKGRFANVGMGIMAPPLTPEEEAQMREDGNSAYYRFDPKKNQCCWDHLNGRKCRYKTRRAKIVVQIRELEKELQEAEEAMDAMAQLDRDERTGDLKAQIKEKKREAHACKCPYKHTLKIVGRKKVDFINRDDVVAEKEAQRRAEEEELRRIEEEKRRKEESGELTEEEKAMLIGGPGQTEFEEGDY